MSTCPWHPVDFHFPRSSHRRRAVCCPSQRKDRIMSEHVYKLLELTGTSSTSIEDAVNGALARAAKTIRNMRWFEVTETRGDIKDGKINHWQVTIKVGF